MIPQDGTENFQRQALTEHLRELRSCLIISFVAVFTALVFSFWKGRQDIFPWLVAALVAVVSESLLPGKWYIVCGGISGAVVAAFQPRAQEERSDD